MQFLAWEHHAHFSEQLTSTWATNLEDYLSVSMLSWSFCRNVSDTYFSHYTQYLSNAMPQIVGYMS